MVTFIEGVDGSGKTTLVKKLVEKYGAIQIPIIPRLKNKEEEYFNWRQWCDVYCNHVKNNQMVIADRSLITEIVYRMQDYEATYLNQSLLNKFFVGSKVIWCTNDSTYEEAMRRGDDNILSKEQHYEREILYKGIMYFINKVLNVPVMKYDWHKTKINKVINFIKE